MKSPSRPPIQIPPPGLPRKPRSPPTSQRNPRDPSPPHADFAQWRSVQRENVAKTYSETMNTDPGILCFQHCDKKVFCFELPELCPVCNKDLSTEQFKLLPIRIPYPFVRAVQHPCSILIKPTSGDFLNDYFNSVDLHIGVTDSTGAVVEYDKNGLQRRKNNQWNQCLVLDGMDESWADHWDEALKTVMKEGHWTPQRYNETSYNCYTFVLAFLQKLEHGLLSNAAYSSTYFCEKFVIPRTTAAGKYISLYRKLRAVKCYIHGGSEVSLSSYQESVPSR